MTKKKTGVYEWASVGINCSSGCLNGCQYCLEATTPILMANGSTKLIEDIKLGDRLLAFTQEEWGPRYVESEVLAVQTSEQPAFELQMLDGRKVVCSANHRWLTGRGWKFTQGCMAGPSRRPYLTTSPNSGIYSIGPLSNEATAEPSSEYMDGYLCGVINGDGTVGEYFYEGPSRSRHIRAFRLAMKDTEPLDRATRFLSRHGVTAIKFSFNPGNGRPPIPAIRTGDSTSFDKIVSILKVRTEPEFLRGFVAGIFDAEGTGGPGSATLRIFNTDKGILSITQEALHLFGFETVIDERPQGGSGTGAVRVRGGAVEAIRFYNTFHPSIGRKLTVVGTHHAHGTAQVQSIRDLGTKVLMFDLTTSTETFIANGLFSHNCYARRIATQRGEFSSFKHFNSELKPKRNIAKERKHYDGVVMFPTMHDIFPENFGECKGTILNLLGAGNTVLITSKPRIHCMLQLFECLEEYKDRVIFRFTIGCDDDAIFQLWEPGAPRFEERFACLVMGHALGYKTSVSMEPMLDPTNVERVVRRLLPHTSPGDFGSLWVGKMNKISDRVGGVSREEIRKIEEAQTDERIWEIYTNLKDLEPAVRWKDSVEQVIHEVTSRRPTGDK